ncbi:MAG: DoxX family membrane protein [Ignavibacteriae bacterium]|nr:DoxX family membrane protein [Ignavibacteriota bacterium]MBK8947197.1 DoxX family membrane protein [Ignavibacteriota bacterium]
MNTYLSLKKWFEKNIDTAFSLIRIFVGFALFVRGIILFVEPSVFTKLTGSDQWYWWYSYVIVIHIIGGVLLGIGLLTRLSALLQIPVLLGAILLFHLKEGLARVEQSLELSTLVLVLLVIFFLFGSGILSVDSYLEKRKVKPY